MAATRKLGWRPDLPDFRDHRVKWGSPFLQAVEIPTAVDLRPQCSAVENQGQVSSCTGNAIVGALEALENKNRVVSASFAVTGALEMLADKADSELIDLSRLFVYWNERNLEGTTEQDAGAYIRDGIKVVASFGACAETLWPYDETRWRERPSHEAFVNGAGTLPDPQRARFRLPHRVRHDSV